MSVVLRVRPPAVAGTFYPADPNTLARLVDGLLADASSSGAGRPLQPKALIVPHAGYVYSGAIAASAYARLAPFRARVSRVVLLGPAHRVWTDGLALPGAERLDTPLGPVRAAEVTIAGVGVNAPAHAQEHSLEVQLPFVQRVLGDVEVVPIVVGDASAEVVAQVIDELWGDASTLVLISSDLSHYHDWNDANGRDARAAAQIEALGPPLTHEQACGATPINGLLIVARQRGLRVECLDLRNSGDTAGQRDRVVGYGAFAFYEQGSFSVTDKGAVLLGLARRAIETSFVGGTLTPPELYWLEEPRAVFVTLRERHGDLRGCIGSIEARLPLGVAVIEAARGAAFRDGRFAPLAPAELEALHIDVSVLSPMTPLRFSNEADAVRQIGRTTPGVLFTSAGRRSVLLPQVWSSIPDAADFLRHLKLKAGLTPASWADDVSLQVFTCVEYAEPGGPARH